MKAKFENFEHDRSVDSSNQEIESPTDDFELISAYIDGELSPTARNRVQIRIDQDPQMKKLYTQLMALQSQMQNLSAPPSKESAAEITEKVFQTIENHRRQRRLTLGGGAIAATLLALFTGFIPGISSPGLRFAQSPNSGEINGDQVMLAVALNKPTIDIPKSINGYAIEHQQFFDSY